MSDLTSVTNKLLNEYNIKFNENYNDIIQLNSTIQNKEQIIMKINEVILYKDRNIIILQYILYYSITFLLITSFYAINNIQLKQYIIIGIFLAILFSIACFIHIQRHFSLYKINQKMESLKVTMVNYTGNLINGIIKPYQCPSQCKTKENTDTDEEDEDKSIESKYKNNSNLLKIDSTANVWKDGDIPVGMNLQTMDEMDDKNSPQPFFGNSYPTNTDYKCKWLGNSGDKNMPKSMIKGKKDYSSIPCHYKPNNTELSRFFCQKDPNDLDSNGIAKYCQEIITDEDSN